jgi:hypothetical protein
VGSPLQDTGAGSSGGTGSSGGALTGASGGIGLSGGTFTGSSGGTLTGAPSTSPADGVHQSAVQVQVTNAGLASVNQ